MGRIGVKFRIINGKRTLTSDDLVKKFNRLPNKVKLELLWEALDMMNQYNGRTRWHCVAIAMGYELDYVKIEGKETEVYVKSMEDGSK